MNICIDREAREWLKQEVSLSEGDFVRFQIRYEEDERNSPLQPGYSIRLALFEEPKEPCGITEVDGIVFFVEQSDQWYFQDHDLLVSYNKIQDDIVYHYTK